MYHNLPDFSDYIVFVDESGSPTLSPIDPDYPIFVLIFCVIKKTTYTNQIQPSIKQLKFDFFGHDMAVIHSHDIRKPKGEFAFLQNPSLREQFMQRMDEMVAAADVELIVHIIDKKALINKYSMPYNPYHIALRMCIEQLTLYLQRNNQHNRLTHIIAEARGHKEDRDLELEFRRIIDPNDPGWGLTKHFSLHTTPMALKFVEKKINSAGLQLADLMGQPIGRNFLKPTQSNRAFEILKKKIYGQIVKFP